VLTPAVADSAGDLPSSDTVPGQTAEPSRDAALAIAIFGKWVSGERDTTRGPMRFTFSIGADGWLDATGFPSSHEQGEQFHLSGPYLMDGNSLTCAAINGGRPVEVRLENGLLHLKIDESLSFRLRRP
jgi:hypothetical protein